MGTICSKSENEVIDYNNINSPRPKPVNITTKKRRTTFYNRSKIFVNPPSLGSLHE